MGSSGINGTGWIHNVVITAKKWSEDKIRMNLDTRPMAKAVKASHFHIPTPQELRHEFRGSDRFSVVDFNNAFHQFPMDEESRNLFTFHTPWLWGPTQGAVSCRRGLG